MESSLEAQAAELTSELGALGVSVVTLDMDQCMVACRSRRPLLRTELEGFTALATPDFAAAARALTTRAEHARSSRNKFPRRALY